MTPSIIHIKAESNAGDTLLLLGLPLTDSVYLDLLHCLLSIEDSWTATAIITPIVMAMDQHREEQRKAENEAKLQSSVCKTDWLQRIEKQIKDREAKG